MDSKSRSGNSDRVAIIVNFANFQVCFSLLLTTFSMCSGMLCVDWVLLHEVSMEKRGGGDPADV